MTLSLFKMTRVGKVATLNLCVVGFLLGASAVINCLLPNWDQSPVGGAIANAGIAIFQLFTFPVGWVAALFMPPCGYDEFFTPLAFFTVALVSNAYLWGWAFNKLMKKKETPNN